MRTAIAVGGAASGRGSFERVVAGPIHGYRPRFGIVEVDRATQKRTPKRSAGLLGAVARANAFDAAAFR